MRRYARYIILDMDNEQTFAYGNLCKGLVVKTDKIKNYIFFEYNDFMESYMPFSYKVSDDIRKKYNDNIKYYKHLLLENSDKNKAKKKGKR